MILSLNNFSHSIVSNEDNDQSGFPVTAYLQLLAESLGQQGSTCIYPWWIHVNVWQNQYSIVK